MKVVEMKLTDIKPYPNNPRYNEEAIDKVAESIRLFGFNQPIVVDDNHTIVAGHTRYYAAQDLGLKTVPVYVWTGRTQDEYNAYRLVDNKTNEYAEWDWAKLDEEILGIGSIDMSIFDLVVEDADSFKDVDFFAPDPEKEEFSITFVFNKEHEEAVSKAIKAHKKPAVTEKVLELLLKLAEEPADVQPDGDELPFEVTDEEGGTGND